jgi:predicted MPP superfamily phosphohydrolase
MTVLDPFSIALGTVFATGVGTYYYAACVEATDFRLETLQVPLRGLTKSLKVLHLSDLHLCEPESKKVAFLEQLMDDDYDLVLLTGDIFENYSGVQYAPYLLSRKPRIGAYAVLGNHDYYEYTMFHKTFGRVMRKYRHPEQKRDVEPMVQALLKTGYTVMRNESCQIDSEKLYIIGIDYPGISQPKLDELSASAPSGYFKLALFHVPKDLNDIAKTGVGFAVGGHTHGGQIRVPGWGALITDSELSTKQASGLFKRQETIFHISRGLSADPKSNIRLFCPPAVTLLELTPAVP